MEKLMYHISLFFLRFQKIPQEVKDLCEKPGVVRLSPGIYAKLLNDNCLVIETGTHLSAGITEIRQQSPCNPELVNRLLKIPGVEDRIYTDESRILIFKVRSFTWKNIIPDLRNNLENAKRGY